jgi:tetratricopeptide (TPR) repeat protein
LWAKNDKFEPFKKYNIIMLNNKSLYAIIAICVMGMTSLQAQTLKTPPASPLQTIKQTFALSEINVEYSRPSAKGRKIFGDLVPFGKIWRTGANAATKITFGEDVEIEGRKLAAGTYAIYTIPNKKSWDVMIYKDLKLGGNTAEYKTENEVLRFSVKPKSMKEMVETFTINVTDVKPNMANIELMWEKTSVSFKVMADIDSKIMKNIENAVAADTLAYYQAANYYYENGKDLNKALEWATKAYEKNPKAFWIMNLKAKIEYKLKNYDAAIASAEKVITLAKEAKNDDYVKMAEALIADAKKAK